MVGAQVSDPATKYADKVDPRHRLAMEGIDWASVLLNLHREQFQAVLESEQHMHSAGGLLDPTLYRDMLYSKSWKQQLRLIRAALAFLNEVSAVAAELNASSESPPPTDGERT